MTDPISDFLTRLRNGSKARREDCVAPYSKLKEGLAAILKAEGYITDYATGVVDGKSLAERSAVGQRQSQRWLVQGFSA